jgi:serine/threonine-protein kinase HipA
MMRRGKVFFRNEFAGIIYENEHGVYFYYDKGYLKIPGAMPVSYTLPLSEEEYSSKAIIPFFDGLIPEGWLLDLAEKNWKINPKDRMGLLLAFCEDCIGAVSIIEDKE